MLAYHLHVLTATPKTSQPGKQGLVLHTPSVLLQGIYYHHYLLLLFSCFSCLLTADSDPVCRQIEDHFHYVMSRDLRVICEALQQLLQALWTVNIHVIHVQKPL